MWRIMFLTIVFNLTFVNAVNACGTGYADSLYNLIDLYNYKDELNHKGNYDIIKKIEDLLKSEDFYFRIDQSELKQASFFYLKKQAIGMKENNVGEHITNNLRFWPGDINVFFTNILVGIPFNKSSRFDSYTKIITDYVCVSSLNLPCEGRYAKMDEKFSKIFKKVNCVD